MSFDRSRWDLLSLRIRKDHLERNEFAQPGYAGSKVHEYCVAFVGINPGMPHLEVDPIIYNTLTDMRKLNEAYENMLKTHPNIDRFLNVIFANTKLDLDHIAWLNIVKIATAENKQPTEQEVSLDKPYLIEQLNILNPKMIVAMGRFPMEELRKIDGLKGMLIHTPHYSWLSRQGILIESSERLAKQISKALNISQAPQKITAFIEKWSSDNHRS